jgi:hypothetical protein
VGAKTVNTTSSQQNAWQPDPTAYNQYYGALQNAGNIGYQPYTPYTKQLVAPFNQTQQQATTGIQGINSNLNANSLAAGQTGASFGNLAGGAANASQLLDPANFQANLAAYYDPYTQRVINATMANIQQQNQLQDQGAIGSAIQGGNAFGGDRMGLGLAALANQQNLASGQTIAGLESAGFGQAAQLSAQNAQQQLAGLSAAGNLTAGQLQSIATQNQAAALGLGGQQALLAAGTQQQQTQQAQDIARYQQFQNRIAWPYQQQSWLGQNLTGLGSQMGGTGQGSGAQTVPAGNWGSTIFGAGLAGAGLVNGLTGSTAAPTSLGGIGSAIGSGLSSLFAPVAALGAVAAPLGAAHGGRIPGYQDGGVTPLALGMSIGEQGPRSGPGSNAQWLIPPNAGAPNPRSPPSVPEMGVPNPPQASPYGNYDTGLSIGQMSSLASAWRQPGTSAPTQARGGRIGSFAGGGTPASAPIATASTPSATVNASTAQVPTIPLQMGNIPASGWNDVRGGGVPIDAPTATAVAQFNNNMAAGDTAQGTLAGQLNLANQPTPLGGPVGGGGPFPANPVTAGITGATTAATLGAAANPSVMNPTVGMSPSGPGPNGQPSMAGPGGFNPAAYLPAGVYRRGGGVRGYQDGGAPSQDDLAALYAAMQPPPPSQSDIAALSAAMASGTLAGPANDNNSWSPQYATGTIGGTPYFQGSDSWRPLAAQSNSVPSGAMNDIGANLGAASIAPSVSGAITPPRYAADVATWPSAPPLYPAAPSQADQDQLAQAYRSSFAPENVPIPPSRPANFGDFGDGAPTSSDLGQLTRAFRTSFAPENVPTPPLRPGNLGDVGEASSPPKFTPYGGGLSIPTPQGTLAYAEPTSRPDEAARLQPAFADKMQDLQQDAADAGVPTTLISGGRDNATQAKLYANRQAYLAGAPVPYPSLSDGSRPAAPPGGSLHNIGVAGDLQANNPRQQPQLIAMASQPWRGIAHPYGNDPEHFEEADQNAIAVAAGHPVPPANIPETQVAANAQPGTLAFAGRQPDTSQAPAEQAIASPQTPRTLAGTSPPVARGTANPYAAVPSTSANLPAQGAQPAQATGGMGILDRLMGRKLTPEENMSILAAGGAMMASRSPFFGGGLGAGVTAGVNEYNTLRNVGSEVGLRQAETQKTLTEADIAKQQLEIQKGVLQKSGMLPATQPTFNPNPTAPTLNVAQDLSKHVADAAAQGQAPPTAGAPSPTASEPPIKTVVPEDDPAQLYAQANELDKQAQAFEAIHMSGAATQAQAASLRQRAQAILELKQPVHFTDGSEPGPYPPSLAMQQNTETRTGEAKATAGKLVDLADTVDKDANAAQMQKATIAQMKEESGGWLHGKYAPAAETIREDMQSLGKTLGMDTSALDKPVAGYEEFAKNSNAMVLGAIRDSSMGSRGGIRLAEMTSRAFPSPQMSDLGARGIFTQLDGFADYKISKQQAQRQWFISHGNDYSGFESNWNSSVSPSAFIMHRMYVDNPDEFKRVMATWKSADKKQLADQLAYIKQHNLVSD